MEHWIIYDKATGAPICPGSGLPGTAAYQSLLAGTALMVVPPQVMTSDWPNLNFTALRAHCAAGIDAEAEKVRGRFLTDGSGQAMTYQRKEAEARAWTVDQKAATPFLSAEAKARGMAIADLAAEVIALADTWVRIGSAIEGLRMGAKAAIAKATTLRDIVAAIAVDWSAVGHA